MQSRVLSARVPADALHANGGLGRRESQGSVSSAGSLDLVSARRAPPLSTGLPGGAGMGGRAAQSTESIPGFISRPLSSRARVPGRPREQQALVFPLCTPSLALPRAPHSAEPPTGPPLPVTWRRRQRTGWLLSCCLMPALENPVVSSLVS